MFYLVATALLAVLLVIVARPKSQSAWIYVLLSGIGFVIAGACFSVLVAETRFDQLVGVLTFSPDIPLDAYAFSRVIALGYVLIFCGVVICIRQFREKPGTGKPAKPGTDPN
jgi:uncharacterized membrane protein HdeD (DUF308 family)